MVDEAQFQFSCDQQSCEKQTINLLVKMVVSDSNNGGKFDPFITGIRFNVINCFVHSDVYSCKLSVWYTHTLLGKMKLNLVI